ncbi:hypothetical protein L6164_015448 [Bauhinia variegata]|uniref:Uncharacterized protein n=1 Tax=Bauhinia variegata TaxID=167791 RepID=A0ACB9NKP6_BAUVA|nr:hypothetical protein L6164_015448 [Bauhinia variegata]
MEDRQIEEGPVAVAEDVEEDPHSEEQCKLEESPFEMLQNSKASVEKIVTEMLSIKNEGKPKSQLRELVTQMFLNFVTLRQANRSILLEEDRVKMETERAKAPVDFTTLQLHNLKYEKSHYVKAIKACKDFKSKYPDIELVPEEEFFRDAPGEIKGSILSNDNAHNLMLKRLNFELFQRKEFCKLHEKLEQQKKSLLETIANRKKFLSSLPSHLKSLKKASLPVQNQLGVPHTKKLKLQHSADLLPPPLYVIYSQLLAQKEAFGESIDLEITGNLKDAQAIARNQAYKDTGNSITVESSKLEDDAPDEEDDQGRRKRRRMIQGNESHDQVGIFQVHPLKVTLHVYDEEVSDPESGKLITLKFEYMVKLNIVCAGIEASNDVPENDILCNLFPDDTGLELPHQSAKLFVGDASIFKSNRTPRPYKWAQHLAGIDFLPEVSPLLLAVRERTEYRQFWREFAPAEKLSWLFRNSLNFLQRLSGLFSLAKLFHGLCILLYAICRLFTCTTKEELEGIREDGELPSMIPKVLAVVDTDSDIDEPANIEPEHEDIVSDYCLRKPEFSWIDYRSKECCLVLSRKMGTDKRDVNLEAKIKISV